MAIAGIAVVGHPHSGTTVLRRHLGAHPDLVDIQEEANFAAFSFGRAAARACREGKVGYVVKQPFVRDDIAKPLAAGVRVVAIVKDPHDIVASMRERGGMGVHAIVHSLSVSAQCLEKWLPRIAAVVRYEDFVASPLRELNRVHRIVGVRELSALPTPGAGAALGTTRVPKEKPDRRDHFRFRVWQVTRPLTTRHVGRGRRILGEQAKQVIASHLGPFMAKYGYAEMGRSNFIHDQVLERQTLPTASARHRTRR